MGGSIFQAEEITCTKVLGWKEDGMKEKKTTVIGAQKTGKSGQVTQRSAWKDPCVLDL